MKTVRDGVAFALALALAAVPLSACGSSASDAPSAAGNATETEAATGEEGESAYVANPFIDCDSAYAAAQLAGFEVTFPEAVPGYSERLYQAIEGEMAQCLYYEGDFDTKVLIRKAVDDGTGDVSGDYGEYGQTTSATVGDVDVTERGDDGLVHVAIWVRDGYAFAIDTDEGLEPEVIEQLVAATS